MGLYKLFLVASAYNSEKSIDNFLNSIVTQSFKNWELLIVDDFSNDDTNKKIKRFIQSDERINLISNKENIGLTKSLIKIINLVPNQSYIVRMDTDEIHNPYYLEKIVSIIKNKKCDLILYSEKKVFLKILSFLNPLMRSLMITLFGNIFKHGSAIFSKELYLKTDGYQNFSYYSQDHLLWVKMLYLSENTYLTSSNNFQIKQLKNNYRISDKNHYEQSLFSIFAILEFIDLLIKRRRKFIYKSLFSLLLILSLILRTIRYFFK